MHSLSYVLFALYKTTWRRLPHSTLKNLDDKTTQFKSYLRSIKIDELSNALLEDIPIHLYFEMTVFVNRTDLHARFIERYNVLMFMRQSLSSCLFFVCIVYLFLLPITIFSIVVEIILFLLSLLLFRQYILTEIGFLDRVFASYLIAKEKMGER